MKKTTRKKRAFGFAQDPFSELVKNDIRNVQAQAAVETNPLYAILEGINAIGAQAGTAAFNNFGTRAYGTSEVEGGEAISLRGNTLKLKGASHEKGGIEIDLPKDAKVFSKRIRVGGKTLADRELARKKKEKRFSDAEDNIIANTLKRVQQTNKAEEGYDVELQNVVNKMFPHPEFAYGTSLPKKKQEEYDPYDPLQEYDIQQELKDHINSVFANPPANATTDNTVGTTANATTQGKKFDFSQYFPTAGEAMGVFGNLYQAFAPYSNTLKNRASDLPNENTFKDIGKQSNKDLDNLVELLRGNFGSQLTQNRRMSKDSKANMAANTRGLNTQRAFSTLADRQELEANNKAYADLAAQLANIAGQRAGINLNADQQKMAAEAVKRENDVRDKDAFYTALSKDQAAVGEGLSKIGKDLNTMKRNRLREQLVNTMGKYFTIENGKLKRNDVEASEDFALLLQMLFGNKTQSTKN